MTGKQVLVFHRTLIPFLLLVLVFTGVSAAAPTMAEVRDSYAAGQYRPTLRSIADCLALKGQAAEGYDHYELLMLKGECLLQLKSPSYAANAFEDARAAAGNDVPKRATAAANELLARRAPALKYVPKSGTNREPIDVLAPDSRKRAMQAMRDDQMASIAPKLERAATADVLTPMLELLPRLREAAVLEFGATGNVDELKPVLTRLGTRAREMISRELVMKREQIEQINAAANSITFNGDIGGSRGLYTDDRKELSALTDYLRQIDTVAHEGLRIAELLGGNPQAWDAIIRNIDEQMIRIDSILNRPR